MPTTGTVAIRIMLNRGTADPADSGLNHVLATAARHSLPVNQSCWGRLDQVKQMAARNPNTTLVIDHLGLQPVRAARASQPVRRPAQHRRTSSSRRVDRSP